MFSLLLLAVVATFFAETKQDPQRSRVTRAIERVYSCAPRYGVPLDCQDWLSRNRTLRDGRYHSCPRGNVFGGWGINHLCDMNGGGWTIVLKRFDGSVDFNRNWDRMKYRIGDLDGEHWLGLDYIRPFTTSGNYSMMVEIREGSRIWTEVYESFTLSGQAEKYMFRADDFDKTSSNNMGIGLALHNYKLFSTRDQDNTNSGGSKSCAAAWKGPGWFNSICGLFIHPFGEYNTSGWWGMKWPIQDRSVSPTELIWKIKRRERRPEHQNKRDILQ